MRNLACLAMSRFSGLIDERDEDVEQHILFLLFLCIREDSICQDLPCLEIDDSYACTF